MTQTTATQVNQNTTRIKDLKEQLRLLESCKIKSIIIRKFDNEALTFQDIEMPVMPRGKVKTMLINHLHEDIKSLEGVIEKL